jgi:hypothetical protein
VIGDAGDHRRQAIGDLDGLWDAVLGPGDGGVGVEELAHRVALALDGELAGDQPPDLVLGVDLGDRLRIAARRPGERRRAIALQRSRRRAIFKRRRLTV